MKLVGLNSDSRLHLSALSGLSRSKWRGIGRRQSHNYRHHFGFDDVRNSQPDKADNLGAVCGVEQELPRFARPWIARFATDDGLISDWKLA